MKIFSDKSRTSPPLGVPIAIGRGANEERDGYGIIEKATPSGSLFISVYFYLFQLLSLAKSPDFALELAF
jgi:hypothetical protein